MRKFRSAQPRSSYGFIYPFPFYLLFVRSVAMRRPIDYRRLTPNQFAWYGALVTTVITIVTVISHYKVLIVRNMKRLPQAERRLTQVLSYGLASKNVSIIKDAIRS